LDADSERSLEDYLIVMEMQRRGMGEEAKWDEKTSVEMD